MTRMGYILDRWKWHWQQSVWKDSGGTWHVRHGPDWATLEAAADLPSGDTSETSVPGKYAWTGGVYTVSQAVGDEITAAGVSGVT